MRSAPESFTKQHVLLGRLEVGWDRAWVVLVQWQIAVSQVGFEEAKGRRRGLYYSGEEGGSRGQRLLSGVGMEQGLVIRMRKRIVGRGGRGGGSSACSIWRV